MDAPSQKAIRPEMRRGDPGTLVLSARTPGEERGPRVGWICVVALVGLAELNQRLVQRVNGRDALRRTMKPQREKDQPVPRAHRRRLARRVVRCAGLGG